MGSFGGADSEHRSATIARYVVAGTWGLSGLTAALGLHGTTRFGMLLVPVAVGYYYRPLVLRWPMLAFVVLAPPAFLELAHYYFHARTSYPLIFWACAGVMAHVLLLFGRMTSARLIAGGAAFLAYLGGAAFVMPASAPPREVCEARVDALTRRVNAFLAAPSTEWEAHGERLPTMHGRPRATAPRALLEVTPQGIWLNGSPMSDAARTASSLRGWVWRSHTLAKDPAQPVEIYLAADAGLKVSEIATLLGLLDHANARLFLLGKLDTGSLGSPPPSAKALAEALDHAPNTPELARLGANELSRRAGPCKPLAKRLVQLNDTPTDARTAVLVKSLDQGLRECQCGLVDIDALEYLVLRLLGASATDDGFIPLPNDENDRPIVPADADLTIEQWAKIL